MNDVPMTMFYQETCYVRVCSPHHLPILLDASLHPLWDIRWAYQPGSRQKGVTTERRKVSIKGTSCVHVQKKINSFFVVSHNRNKNKPGR